MIAAAPSDAAARSDEADLMGVIQLARSNLVSGRQSSIDQNTNKQGFAVPEDALKAHKFKLYPINHSMRLEREGVALMDVKEELRAAGVVQGCDLSDVNCRRAIGAVLLAAIEKRFGKRAVHLADTSRVNGAAVYGEATVRDTGSPTLRGAHHAFHLDKYWPGICEMYGCATLDEAARRTIGDYSGLWGADWKRLGLSEKDAASALLGQDGLMIQVWVSLTPGGIQQSPLALMDSTSITLSKDTVATLPVTFKGLNDTISLIKESAVDPDKLRILWRPSMQFGEAFIFLTQATPHSAIWVEGAPDVSRQSAEMRMLVVDDDKVH